MQILFRHVGIVTLLAAGRGAGRQPMGCRPGSAHVAVALRVYRERRQATSRRMVVRVAARSRTMA